MIIFLLFLLFSKYLSIVFEGKGCNEYSVLGTGNTQIQPKRIVIGKGSFISDMLTSIFSKFHSVECGEGYTIITLKDFSINSYYHYGFGKNTHGALAMKSYENFNVVESPKTLPLGENGDFEVTLKSLSSKYTHSLYIDSNSVVKSNGDNSYMKQCVDRYKIIKEPTIIEPFENSSISQISAGKTHSLFVTDDNMVYGCGCNENYQLSEKSFSYTSSPFLIRLPEHGMKIQKIDAGGTFTVIVEENKPQRVFVRGIFFGPFDTLSYKDLFPIFRLSNENFVSISAGDNHFVVCSEKNGIQFLRGFGVNYKSCLGHKEREGAIAASTFDLDVLEKDEKIIKVIAKGERTAVLTNDGRIIIWGRQFNKRDDDGGTAVVYLSEEFSGKIVDFSLSSTHLVAISESLIYSMGENDYYQCMTGELGWISSDNKIKLAMSNPLEKKEIWYFSTGRSLIFAIDSDFKVWTWGVSSTSEMSDNWLTKYIPRQYELIDNIRIKRICSSENNRFFLTEFGEVYAVGVGKYGALGNGDLSPITHPQKIQYPCDLDMKNYNSEVLKIEIESTFTIAQVRTCLLTNKSECETHIYSHGYGKLGQLGQGKTSQMILKPIKIEFPMEEEIQDFCISRIISIFLTRNNKVYFTGRFNEQVELFEIVFRPKLIENITGKVTHMGCGIDFQIIVVDKRIIYLAGILKDQIFKNFTRMENWKFESDIIYVDNIYHALFTLENGQVYGVGENKCGQIDSSFSPEYVDFPALIQTQEKIGIAKVTHYSSIFLGQIHCNGIPSSDENVCNGHGVCVEENKCACLDFWGDGNNFCMYSTCNGIVETNASFVCNGHGACLGDNKCKCEEDFSDDCNPDLSTNCSGTERNNFCFYPQCPPINYNWMKRNTLPCNYPTGSCEINENGKPYCKCNPLYFSNFPFFTPCFIPKIDFLIILGLSIIVLMISCMFFSLLECLLLCRCAKMFSETKIMKHTFETFHVKDNRKFLSVYKQANVFNKNTLKELNEISTIRELKRLLEKAEKNLMLKHHINDRNMISPMNSINATDIDIQTHAYDDDDSSVDESTRLMDENINQLRNTTEFNTIFFDEVYSMINDAMVFTDIDDFEMGKNKFKEAQELYILRTNRMAKEVEECFRRRLYSIESFSDEKIEKFIVGEEDDDDGNNSMSKLKNPGNFYKKISSFLEVEKKNIMNISSGEIQLFPRVLFLSGHGQRNIPTQKDFLYIGEGGRIGFNIKWQKLVETLLNSFVHFHSTCFDQKKVGFLHVLVIVDKCYYTDVESIVRKKVPFVRENFEQKSFSCSPNQLEYKSVFKSSESNSSLNEIHSRKRGSMEFNYIDYQQMIKDNPNLSEYKKICLENGEAESVLTFWFAADDEMTAVPTGIFSKALVMALNKFEGKIQRVRNGEQIHKEVNRNIRKILKDRDLKQVFKGVRSKIVSFRFSTCTSIFHV